MRVCRKNPLIFRGARKILSRGRGTPLRRSIVVATAILISIQAGCGQPDSVSTEKGKTLTPDERYLVELYMKINNLEINLQDNPADSAKKWDELRGTVDRERVQRTLEELKKDPERWITVYGRINELYSRQEK